MRKPVIICVKRMMTGPSDWVGYLLEIHGGGSHKKRNLNEHFIQIKCQFHIK